MREQKLYIFEETYLFCVECMKKDFQIFLIYIQLLLIAMNDHDELMPIDIFN